jgi:hypothetical protein
LMNGLNVFGKKKTLRRILEMKAEKVTRLEKIK